MIERDTIDGVELVRMDHGRVNALDVELLTTLADTFDTLGRAAAPLVLTGTGGAFSAGVDLRRIVAGEAKLDGFLAVLSRAFIAIFDYPGPTIAAINGHAIAGGYVLAAACDHRIAADGDARLGLSELQVGVPFPTEAIEIVRHAVGTQVAARLVLTAELVDAAEAARIGLVDELVPADALEATAVARAKARAALGADAYGLAKRQLQRPVRAQIAAALGEDEPIVLDLWTRPAAHDRMRAFLREVTGR
jgi:enoyl-CoA hydratase